VADVEVDESGSVSSAHVLDGVKNRRAERCAAVAVEVCSQIMARA
jgi:hypothetical protein